MATSFNLSPEGKQGVIDFIVGNIGNPEAIRQAAQRFGATANDLASITGIPVDQVHQYFLNAGVPMGTVLTGDVQRTFGTEGNIRQLDKGEDVTVEKAIGRQGDKIVVQRYDAYGTPTTTRLADPNTSEGRGWLQALGIVGGAIGLSSIPEISSLFGGAEAATAAAPTVVAAETAAPVVTATGGSTAAPVVTTAGSTLPAATVAGGTAPTSLTVASTSIPAASTISPAVVGAGLLSGAALTSALTSEGIVANEAANVAQEQGVTEQNPADVATPGITTTPPPPTPITTTPPPIPTLPTNLSSLLGNLFGSGANLAMVNDAADKLRRQGQISQDEYNKLSTNLFNVYRSVGADSQQALANIGERASQMVGEFTPYGVSTNLVNTQFNPQTGQLESNISPVAQMLMAPLGRAAIQSAQAAEMTNVDQLSQDYYNKLAALSAPEAQRQRLATEERMRQQGRLGLLGSGLDVTGQQVSTAAPELTALEQALARQQLEREVQSRNLALGERGTLLSQAQQAYAPLQQISQQALQQAQLSGQLGQLSQAGRIAASQAYANPAITSVTAPLNFYAQGLPQVASTQRLGIASNLAAQQAALDAQAVGRTNVANQLLGQNGSNIGNLLSSGVNFFTNPNAAGNLNTLGFGTGLGYGNQDIGLFI